MAELFWVLSHIVKLKLRPRNLSIVRLTNLDVECQAFAELVLDNLENGAIRASRQWSNFRSNDDEIVSGSKGNSLACPGADRVIPPVPPGLALRRPRFWLELPPTGATPERRRDSASEDSETIADLPHPKRPARLDSALRDDISRQFGGSAVQADVPRYPAGDALRNPLRGYPEPMVLFGMEIKKPPF